MADQRLHFHSRATFITDMREARGNKVALVRPYSGQSLESFKRYLHAQRNSARLHGCIATDQRVESVGLFLASFAGTKGISGTQGTLDQKGKSLEKQRIAVS